MREESLIECYQLIRLGYGNLTYFAFQLLAALPFFGRSQYDAICLWWTVDALGVGTTDGG